VFFFYSRSKRVHAIISESFTNANYIVRRVIDLANSPVTQKSLLDLVYFAIEFQFPSLFFRWCVTSSQPFIVRYWYSIVNFFIKKGRVPAPNLGEKKICVLRFFNFILCLNVDFRKESIEKKNEGRIVGIRWIALYEVSHAVEFVFSFTINACFNVNHFISCSHLSPPYHSKRSCSNQMKYSSYKNRVGLFRFHWIFAGSLVHCNNVTLTPCRTVERLNRLFEI